MCLLQMTRPAAYSPVPSPHAHCPPTPHHVTPRPAGIFRWSLPAWGHLLSSTPQGRSMASLCRPSEFTWATVMSTRFITWCRWVWPLSLKRNIWLMRHSYRYVYASWFVLLWWSEPEDSGYIIKWNFSPQTHCVAVLTERGGGQPSSPGRSPHWRPHYPRKWRVCPRPGPPWDDRIAAKGGTFHCYSRLSLSLKCCFCLVYLTLAQPSLQFSLKSVEWQQGGTSDHSTWEHFDQSWSSSKDQTQRQDGSSLQEEQEER